MYIFRNRIFCSILNEYFTNILAGLKEGYYVYESNGPTVLSGHERFWTQGCREVKNKQPGLLTLMFS